MVYSLRCFCLLILVLAIYFPDRALGVVQPGETVTKDTMAQAAELLTPVTQWMLERGMSMPIIDTKKVQWPKAYQEATDKYAGQVKLADDGKELYDYVAGCPFPIIDINNALAGFRVMWNHVHGPHNLDNTGTDLFAELVNNKGEIERTYETPWRRLMWEGRLYTDPKPRIAHTPPVRSTNLWGPYFLPSDLKGLAVLDIRYLDPATADDTYAYYPETRRVRRLSVSDRGGALGGILGTDYDIDSFLGFNGSLRYWQFRVLAEKDILAVVHSGKYGDQSAWCAPRDGAHGILAALPCVSWEKRRVWVIEAIPDGYPSPYPYSKRVLYIDQDFFFPVITELYDQRGELWKGLVHSVFYTKKPYAGYPAKPIDGAKYNYTEEQPFIPNWVLIDLQQVHATVINAPSGYKKPTEWQTEWYFNEAVSTNTPTLYSLQALQQVGR